MFDLLKRTRPARRARTPTVIQMEMVECGAACLGIILGYHGRHVSLSELRAECGVSRDGSQASNVLKAARGHNMVAKGYRWDLEQLRDSEPPSVVFWNFNHFVVVEGFRDDLVYLNDPATGPRTVSLQEFSESYTGITLHMKPGPEFERGGRKPAVLPSLYRRLRGSVNALAWCILAGLLLVVPELAVAVFGQIFVDSVLIQQMTDWLRPLVLGMLVTAVLRGGIAALQLTYLRRLKIKLGVVMSGQFLWHLLRLPARFYAQRYAGEIASRIHLNDKVADILSGQLATNAIQLIMVVFYAIVMIQYDVLMASIGILSAVANVVALQVISRYRVDANMRLLECYGKVEGISIAGLQGLETLKASGLESHFFSRWAGHLAKASGAQQELAVSNQKLGVLPTLLSSLTTVVILIIGGLRVMDGTFSIGMLVAFQSLMQSFLAPVGNLVGLSSTIQEVRGDLGRLNDLQDYEPDPQTAPERAEGTDSVSHLEGTVELRDVTFGYDRTRPPLIENLSLALRPGERIAIVGGSGSGKSTVARLISGLFEPWSGEIMFDGRPRRSLARGVLTASVGMVEQEILLFEGTVRENLALWDPSTPEEEMERACRDAAIHDDIMLLTGGYNGVLDEGGRNLSGGQRQRVEIARALVGNPAVLILDEATSALDAETERVIDRNLRRRGCSCIIIAHRLSTIRDCDQILVLHEGKVVEQGSHDRLWAAQGAYARLVSADGQ